MIVTKLSQDGLLSNSDIVPGQRVVSINGIAIVSDVLPVDVLTILKNADAGTITVVTSRIGLTARIGIDFTNDLGPPHVIRTVPQLLKDY